MHVHVYACIHILIPMSIWFVGVGFGDGGGRAQGQGENKHNPSKTSITNITSQDAILKRHLKMSS